MAGAKGLPPPGRDPKAVRALFGLLQQHWAERHYRNGYYLMLNNVAGAVAGLLFWLVLVRWYAVSKHDISTGIAFVSLSTALALLAKGGLDLALVRHVPGATRREGVRLLRLAMVTACAIVAVLVLAVAALQRYGLPQIDGINGASLALLGVVAALLAANWLQDAHFLAEGEARFSFYRNLAFHGGRLVTPVIVLSLALPYPIPVAWGLALLVSVVLAVALLPKVPDPRGRAAPALASVVAARAAPAAAAERGAERVPRRAFFRTAIRNLTGSSAEFLPGLFLPPLVLHLEGDQAGAYFGIAWTGASMLFLLCAAISRSTLSEMSRQGRHATWLRGAIRQHVLVVAPATVLTILAAPVLLALFGADYAAAGWPVFAVFAASVVFVGPVYLYLALLRSRDARGVLVAYPAVLLVLLAVMALPLEQAYGMVGVAMAWMLAHVPLAAIAVRQLRAELALDPDPSPRPLISPGLGRARSLVTALAAPRGR